MQLCPALWSCSENNLRTCVDIDIYAVRDLAHGQNGGRPPAMAKLTHHYDTKSINPKTSCNTVGWASGQLGHQFITGAVYERYFHRSL